MRHDDVNEDEKSNNILIKKVLQETEKLNINCRDNKVYKTIEVNNTNIHKTNIELNNSKCESPKNKFLEYVFTEMPFTQYHLMMIFSIFLIRTIEGSETISLALGLETYKLMHNLTDNEVALIVFLIFFGNFLGCLISIVFGNKYPRKTLIKIGSFMIISFGIISILTKSVFMFTLSQNLVNMGIGILLANTTAIMTESFNMNYRGFVLNLMLLSNSMGEIYISFCLDYALHADDHHLRNKYEISKLFLFMILPVKIYFNKGFFNFI